MDGHRSLSLGNPHRLAAISRQIERFEAGRTAAGLSLEDLEPGELGAGGVARLAGQNAGALLLLPLAVAGALIHYPAYRLAGVIARRIVPPGEDVLATAKVFLSMLFFPATWLACAAVAWHFGGWPGGAAALVVVPLAGWSALAAGEALQTVVGRAWALFHLLFRRSAMRRLLARRAAIRRQIVELGDEV